MINHIIRHTCTNHTKKCYRWLFARQTSNSAAYEGDGRTTVRVLNDEIPHLNLVNTYSAQGFRLANNLFIVGSILLFPTHVYSWNVKRGIDITPESLIVFDLIVPKTKMVIIGYGERGEPYDPKIPLILKKKGISCEMLPTPHAITTYNYMVHDAVHVAGAFVPMQYVKMTKRDLVAMKAHDEMVEEREHVPNTTEESDVELAELKRRYLRDSKDKKTFED